METRQVVPLDAFINERHLVVPLGVFDLQTPSCTTASLCCINNTRTPNGATLRPTSQHLYLVHDLYGLFSNTHTHMFILSHSSIACTDEHIVLCHMLAYI